MRMVMCMSDVATWLKDVRVSVSATVPNTSHHFLFKITSEVSSSNPSHCLVVNSLSGPELAPCGTPRVLPLPLGWLFPSALFQWLAMPQTQMFDLNEKTKRSRRAGDVTAQVCSSQVMSRQWCMVIRKLYLVTMLTARIRGYCEVKSNHSRKKNKWFSMM